MLNAKSANDASSQSAFKARWMKSMTRKNLGEALGCQNDADSGQMLLHAGMCHEVCVGV